MGTGKSALSVKLVFFNDTVFKYALGNSSAVGGAERQQWLLARALAANGWSVRVGISEGMTRGQHEVIDQVHFTGIGHGPGHVMCAWARFLAAQRPQWWYWRCANHLLGPAVAMARAQNVRTIFATALDPDVDPRRALYHRSRWWPLYAWGLSWADKIFVQHTGQLNAVALKWRSKSYIVPSLAGETQGGASHLDRGKFVAWVAVLRQPKRPDLLIEIARKAPDIDFVVCGGTTTFMSPPGYGERIVKELRALPNVNYLGPVSPEKAQEVIAQAAVLLSTSDEEGFPNTFLQAWSSGTPVVSFKVNPDNVINEKRLGRISGSVDRAIVDIKALVDSPQTREKMGERARRHVKEVHSEASIVKLFERATQNTRARKKKFLYSLFSNARPEQ